MQFPARQGKGPSDLVNTSPRKEFVTSVDETSPQRAEEPLPSREDFGRPVTHQGRAKISGPLSFSPCCFGATQSLHIPASPLLPRPFPFAALGCRNPGRLLEHRLLLTHAERFPAGPAAPATLVIRTVSLPLLPRLLSPSRLLSVSPHLPPPASFPLSEPQRLPAKLSRFSIKSGFVIRKTGLFSSP